MRFGLFVALALLGCGGNAWTDADSKAATDAVRAQQLLAALCDSDAGCSHGQVHLVEHETSCNLASMLHRHGATDVADAGSCK
jgi:hypothetical protein